jgi:Zn-dependent metalloprotease
MRLLHNLLGVAIAATLVSSLHPFSTEAAANPANRALGLIDANPGSAHRNAGDGFGVLDVMVDANGTEHVRLERTFRGLPVIGGDIVVHSRDGALKSVSKSLKSALRPNVDARIGRDDAIVAAGTIFGPGIESIPTARKVVYALGASPVLAWEIRLQGTYTNGADLDMTYYVDATSGNVLLANSNVMFGKPASGKGGTTTTTTTSSAAVGTGRSLYVGGVALNTTASGTSFNLTDGTRGGNATFDANNVVPGARGDKGTLFSGASNAWGDGTLANRATVAADAHHGLARAWDYFSQVFGRRGVRGDGTGSQVFVHVRTGWANASWSNNAIQLGDGDATMRPVVSLDLIAHELSHGVTESTARLVYSGESGGLNESTSDIFGTMAEFHANSADDAPDYMIGEKLFVSKEAGRFMYLPSLDGKSPDCYSAAVATMNPHQASAIGNHFFYLLAEGAVAPANAAYLTPSQLVCNGNTALAGVGRDAAQKIWYQALTRYMTSGTTYSGARSATLQASADLFGAGSAQQQAVAAAWSAVGVN